MIDEYFLTPYVSKSFGAEISTEFQIGWGLFHYMPLIQSMSHQYSTHSFVKLVLWHFRVWSSYVMCSLY